VAAQARISNLLALLPDQSAFRHRIAADIAEGRSRLKLAPIDVDGALRDARAG
jgi:hypothetical protein